MRLGLVIYGSLDTLSGGYLYDRKLVEYLRAQGDVVDIISLPWRSYPAHLTDNLRYRLPEGYDLIIQDELNHPSLIAANRDPRPCPVVSLVHHLRCSEPRPDWLNRLYRAVERRYLNSVDGFIFNSGTTRQVVEALAGDTRPAMVAYPPTDRFGTALPEADVRQRAAGATLRILFLGNLIPRKGLHTLLLALATLEFPFRLEVVGSLESDPVYTRIVQKTVLQHGLADRVRFHGALEQAQLADVLRGCHMLALPSSYEGFGIAYLEGMGFGLPAIATTSGAAAEIISDGQDGFLVPAGDAALLGERISRLAGDRALLVRMALNALERYRRQPAWVETAARIRDFLLTFV